MATPGTDRAAVAASMINALVEKGYMIPRGDSPEAKAQDIAKAFNALYKAIVDQEIEAGQRTARRD